MGNFTLGISIQEKEPVKFLPIKYSTQRGKAFLSGEKQGGAKLGKGRAAREEAGMAAEAAAESYPPSHA